MRAHDRRYRRLRRSVLRAYGPAATHVLDDSYRIAADVHAGQHRRSGAPYIEHPIEVAQLLVTWQQPISSVCAGLLHDIPDELTDLRPVRDRVGDEVIDLVEKALTLNVTHLPADFRAGHPLHHVAIITLADRLHNARTWRFVPRASARAKARQTLSIYAPAALVLGLPMVAQELTSLATATLDTKDRALTTGTEIAELPPLEVSAHVSGVAGRLLGRAILTLPPARRHRYLEEWSAELLTAPRPGTRLAMAIGLNYSALRMRA